MKIKPLKVFSAGMLISWLGALPLGTLNVTAFDLAASKGFSAAFTFAVAAILVELFYVRLSLWGAKKVVIGAQWISRLLLLGCFFLLYLAISNWMIPIMTESILDKPNFTFEIASPLLLGLLLSALNPLQFPFWLTWNKVLERKGILGNENDTYASYMLGIGLGTFLGLSLFIWLGSKFMTNYETYALYSNKILGAIYFGFSIYLFFLFYQRSLKPIYK